MGVLKNECPIFFTEVDDGKNFKLIKYEHINSRMFSYNSYNYGNVFKWEDKHYFVYDRVECSYDQNVTSLILYVIKVPERDLKTSKDYYGNERITYIGDLQHWHQQSVYRDSSNSPTQMRLYNLVDIEKYLSLFSTRGPIGDDTVFFTDVKYISYNETLALDKFYKKYKEGNESMRGRLLNNWEKSYTGKSYNHILTFKYIDESGKVIHTIQHNAYYDI